MTKHERKRLLGRVGKVAQQMQIEQNNRLERGSFEILLERVMDLENGVAEVKVEVGRLEKVGKTMRETKGGSD